MAAKKKTTTNKNLTAEQKVGIGIGLTAAAVAAAGAYFLYGSANAGKNRKKIKSWALMAKAEVLEALEQAEKMTAEEYHDLVEMVGGAYASVEGVTKGEIKDFKQEMKDNWKRIEKSSVAKKVKKIASTAGAQVAKKTVKPTAKKATKPTAKKTAKKKA